MNGRAHRFARMEYITINSLHLVIKDAALVMCVCVWHKVEDHEDKEGKVKKRSNNMNVHITIHTFTTTYYV